MNNNDVVKISHIKNIRVRNNHNGVLFPMQNILKIKFRDGKSRTIDLMANRDMTDISYFQIVETKKTKEKIIFEENFI